MRESKSASSSSSEGSTTTMTTSLTIKVGGEEEKLKSTSPDTLLAKNLENKEEKQSDHDGSNLESNVTTISDCIQIPSQKDESKEKEHKHGDKLDMDLSLKEESKQPDSKKISTLSKEQIQEEVGVKVSTRSQINSSKQAPERRNSSDDSINEKDSSSKEKDESSQDVGPLSKNTEEKVSLVCSDTTNPTTAATAKINTTPEESDTLGEASEPEQSISSSLLGTSKDQIEEKKTDEDPKTNSVPKKKDAATVDENKIDVSTHNETTNGLIPQEDFEQLENNQNVITRITEEDSSKGGDKMTKKQQQQQDNPESKPELENHDDILSKSKQEQQSLSSTSQAHEIIEQKKEVSLNAFANFSSTERKDSMHNSSDDDVNDSEKNMTISQATKPLHLPPTLNNADNKNLEKTTTTTATVVSESTKGEKKEEVSAIPVKEEKPTNMDVAATTTTIDKIHADDDTNQKQENSIDLKESKNQDETTDLPTSLSMNQKDGVKVNGQNELLSTDASTSITNKITQIEANDKHQHGAAVNQEVKPKSNEAEANAVNIKESFHQEVEMNHKVNDEEEEEEESNEDMLDLIGEHSNEVKLEDIPLRDIIADDKDNITVKNDDFEEDGSTSEKLKLISPLASPPSTTLCDVKPALKDDDENMILNHSTQLVVPTSFPASISETALTEMKDFTPGKIIEKNGADLPNKKFFPEFKKPVEDKDEYKKSSNKLTEVISFKPNHTENNISDVTSNQNSTDQKNKSGPLHSQMIDIQSKEIQEGSNNVNLIKSTNTDANSKFEKTSLPNNNKMVGGGECLTGEAQDDATIGSLYEVNDILQGNYNINSTLGDEGSLPGESPHSIGIFHTAGSAMNEQSSNSTDMTNKKVDNKPAMEHCESKESSDPLLLIPDTTVARSQTNVPMNGVTKQNDDTAENLSPDSKKKEALHIAPGTDKVPPCKGEVTPRSGNHYLDGIHSRGFVVSTEYADTTLKVVTENEESEYSKSPHKEITDDLSDPNIQMRSGSLETDEKSLHKTNQILKEVAMVDLVNNDSNSTPGSAKNKPVHDIAETNALPNPTTEIVESTHEPNKAVDHSEMKDEKLMSTKEIDVLTSNEVKNSSNNRGNSNEYLPDAAAQEINEKSLHISMSPSMTSDSKKGRLGDKDTLKKSKISFHYRTPVSPNAVLLTKHPLFNPSLIKSSSFSTGNKKPLQLKSNDLQKMKTDLFIEFARVHRGKGSERLFSLYWEKMGRYLSASLTPSPSFWCTDDASPDDEEGWETYVKKYLPTRSLRKLHNRLILAIMKHSLQGTMSSSKLKRHAPQKWIKKLKKKSKTDSSQIEKNEKTLPCHLEHLRVMRNKSDLDEDEILLNNLDSKFGEYSDAWINPATPYSGNHTNFEKNDHVDEYTTTSNTATSATLPGALFINPTVKQLVKGDPNLATNLDSEKRMALTSEAIAKVLGENPNLGGGAVNSSLSRLGWERCSWLSSRSSTPITSSSHLNDLNSSITNYIMSKQPVDEVVQDTELHLPSHVHVDSNISISQSTPSNEKPDIKESKPPPTLEKVDASDNKESNKADDEKPTQKKPTRQVSRGKGRGVKDLSAMRARVSTNDAKTPGEKNSTSKEEDKKKSDKSSDESGSKADAKDSKDNDATPKISFGRGFGSKNLKALRKRSLQSESSVSDDAKKAASEDAPKTNEKSIEDKEKGSNNSPKKTQSSRNDETENKPPKRRKQQRRNALIPERRNPPPQYPMALSQPNQFARLPFYFNQTNQPGFHQASLNQLNTGPGALPVMQAPQDVASLTRQNQNAAQQIPGNELMRMRIAEQQRSFPNGEQVNMSNALNTSFHAMHNVPPLNMPQISHLQNGNQANILIQPQAYQAGANPSHGPPTMPNTLP